MSASHPPTQKAAGLAGAGAGAGPGAGRRNPTANPPSTGTGTGTAPLSRSPSRIAASQGAAGSASPAANGLNRTRSVRTGAPVSARAAAASRKQTPDPAEEDAKAEMNAKMEELQQKLQEAERSYEESQKQAAVLQVKLNDALKEQGMLEESVHEHTERINDLENEKKESLRARREMEQIYESERLAAMKEKEEAMAREEEQQDAMQRMKETLAQREMRAGLDDERRPLVSRHSSQGRSSNPSPSADVSDRQFAPPSVQRSDSSSRHNSKLLMQKDKLIESLRLELAEAQIKLVEVENMGGGRMQELQKQVYDIKMQNARLMEENESFQLLLSEKTLNGDFLRPPSHTGSRPPSRNPDTTETSGTSLADELESHSDSEGGEDHRRVQAEVNSLKDQNKALTLYINNIISRLLQHDGLEQILDKTPDLMSGPTAASRKNRDADTDKELPLPPSEKDEQPAGLLQRARSVLGGKARPRPLSQTINSDHHIEPPLRTPVEPSLHENPSTAPSVPIGRSSSVRTPSGHRRANSEWPAASVVTNMYRGPSPGMGGPLSPGLTSPNSRNSFFGGPIRAPSSGSNVPTISETAAAAGAAATVGGGEKENIGPQRDSKMSSANSNRNSIMSNPSAGSGPVLDAGLHDLPVPPPPPESFLGSERSNPSSPPRSVNSSGDRESKSSGAIMMGSKPRPLRLVQEAADEDHARRLQQHQQQQQQQGGGGGGAGGSNRGSWFGWMNKGIPGAPGTSAAGVLAGVVGGGGGSASGAGGLKGADPSSSSTAFSSSPSQAQ